MSKECENYYKNGWCRNQPEVLQGGKFNPNVYCKNHKDCYYKTSQKTIALQTRIIELMAEGISDVQIRHVRFYELSPLIKAQQEIINYYTNKAKEETNA